MTNKWFNIKTHIPDPKLGFVKEGDRILVYGDGYALLGECIDGKMSIKMPEKFTITHWQIAELPEEEDDAPLADEPTTEMPPG